MTLLELLNFAAIMSENSFSNMWRKGAMSVTAILAATLDALATAGFAERFNEYQAWIFPAYLYNWIFGVIFAVILTVIFFIWRKPLSDAL